MMISYNDALSKNIYFSKLCTEAASILRYYQVAEIVKMINSAKWLESEVLSELSSLTAEMRLSTDIIIKEQEEELFPLLSGILQKIKSTSSNATKCYITANAAGSRAKSVIRERINASDQSVVDNYRDVASPYKNEPLIRDAIGAIDMSNRLNSLCSSQSEMSKDILKLESIRPKFICRHYNILLKIKNTIKEKLSLVNEISSIIDACELAMIVINSFDVYDRTIINNFLDANTEDIVSNMSVVYIKSNKGET